MKRNVTYLQLAVIGATVGAILYCLKFKTFWWGDVAVLKCGATWNEVWYFNMESLSTGAFMGSFAYIGAHLSKEFKRSKVCWVIKYSSIAFALVAAARSIFHLVLYNNVIVLEIIVDIALIMWTIYRSSIWYNKNLKRNE